MTRHGMSRPFLPGVRPPFGAMATSYAFRPGSRDFPERLSDFLDRAFGVLPSEGLLGFSRPRFKDSVGDLPVLVKH